MFALSNFVIRTTSLSKFAAHKELQDVQKYFHVWYYHVSQYINKRLMKNNLISFMVS